MDYGYPERRKNRNDKRAKRKLRVYKQGGSFRSSGVSESKSSHQQTSR